MARMKDNMAVTETESTASRLSKPVRITDQQWPEGTVPTVSVFSWAYNHANFIQESLESILIQKTTFPVEIIIHDDASTDGTAEIIKAYELRYPGLFQNILQIENQWSQGKSVMEPFYSKPRGEYVALLHGDDHWTSEDKLQSQVERFGQEEKMLLCFHDHADVDAAGCVIGVKRTRISNRHFSPGAFFKNECGFIATSSMMLRKKIFDLIPDWFHQLPFGDVSLQALASLHGPLGHVPEVYCEYRRHVKGVYSQSEMAQDEHVYIKGRMFWLEAASKMFYQLAYETSDQALRNLCRNRSFRDYMDVVWLARLAGDQRRVLINLYRALRAAPLTALRHVQFWKQLVFGFFPILDLRKRRHLEDFRERRSLVLGTSSTDAEKT